LLNRESVLSSRRATRSRIKSRRLWSVLAMLRQKEETARTFAADSRSLTRSTLDPETFENQAKASGKAHDAILSLLENEGHFLFPSLARKNPGIKL
jgi:hypothetical protein